MIYEVLARLRREPSKILVLFTPRGPGVAYAIIRRTLKTRAALREKERRLAEFKTAAWKHQDGFSQRTTYATYEEYAAHQRSKLDAMIADGTGVRLKSDFEMFRARFQTAPLKPNASVLCLAARLGAEVEAFISLGHFAVGIDLNPGPDNIYVVKGDFHALQFADASVDCIYTNSLDHAFDLEKILGQVRRVLKPGGIFLLEAVVGHEEGYVVGPHDTMHWPTARKFAETMAAMGGFAIESGRDLAPVGSPQWWQFVLRKSA